MLDKSKMTTEELKRYEKFEDEFFDVYNDDEVVELTPEEIEEDRLYEERKNIKIKKACALSIEEFDEMRCKYIEKFGTTDEYIEKTNIRHRNLYGCDYTPYKYYKSVK